MQQLGDAAGVSKPHIHLLENGGSVPKITTAYTIAAVLGKSVYDIWLDDTEVEVIENITLKRVVTRPNNSK